MVTKDYMRKYMARRRAERLAKLRNLLGGYCVECGTTDDLEFDHADPETKSFEISSRALDGPWAALLAEAEKCELRCRPCHWKKSVESGDIVSVPPARASTG